MTASAAFSAAAGRGEQGAAGAAVPRTILTVKTSKKIATLCCRKTAAMPERRQFSRCRRVSIFLPRVTVSRGTVSLDRQTDFVGGVGTVARERATLRTQDIMRKDGYT